VVDPDQGYEAATKAMTEGQVVERFAAFLTGWSRLVGDACRPWVTRGLSSRPRPTNHTHSQIAEQVACEGFMLQPNRRCLLRRARSWAGP
jgi:hypothetical protein